MKRLGKTPEFRGPNGEIIPESIAEIAYHRFGGVHQWVMIRGESALNPPLILLHGGPGFPEMKLFRHFNAELEKHFTVVYWEQRGTDKSFHRKIPKSSMTIDQLIADLNELVDLVRKRLNKTKVILYGHSWGSVLGVLYASRFPEKVAAYVGAGQIGDWPAGEMRSYELALAEAERRENQKALRQLRAIGPPPHDIRKLFTQRKWVVRFLKRQEISPTEIFRISVRGPESSIFDLYPIFRGMYFSTAALWEEISRVNLVELAPALKMPVFFFLGRQDRIVPSEISKAYFDFLSAPSKSLLWFEESGHEPATEEPEKFNQAMLELVRPIAVSEENRSAA